MRIWETHNIREADMKRAVQVVYLLEEARVMTPVESVHKSIDVALDEQRKYLDRLLDGNA